MTNRIYLTLPRNAAKKAKQKRHNNFIMVAKDPQPWQTESVFIPEGNFDFPALPVSTTQLIVVGSVRQVRTCPSIR
jgi:hypothetical protein